ncbi:IS607 family element RNA-guided endonuclease TnpB [Bifidobacterium callitrichos]|uniref:Transposase, IS605 OrfB family n=1 Tax=Bifidobacterium callitrichos DSM 23973 TaxID=1437609 RepID=A0A087A223_9BIFI|nr:IS607 family element RNA-guided endonuclease TnpB [Bifidobacterium callitrichos]KFI52823.1 transposase, IS605 OrfB family [Bifidobacterium callitrichos DSM 23973]
MLEAVKVVLDPTPAQERLLSSHAGAARFSFNAGLAHVKAMIDAQERPEWSLYALRRWWNANKDTLAVDKDGVPWWRENSKEAYNSGLEALSNALRNWSESRKGQRKGRRVGFPGFRSKDRATPRFAYTTGSYGPIPGDPRALRLPRIGRVHCMENVAKRVGDGRVLRMTVSRHACRWHASLTVERADPAPATPSRGGAVGIDLGVRTLATLSDGTVIANPHALEGSEHRLRRVQKALSRRTRGSNRRRRTRERVARLHARVANQRRDLLHKLTTRLASIYSDISIEDLNVAGMVRNHRLAKAVEDASFHELRRQLEYKTARTGARLHVVDRWYPSSKTCSDCGRVKAKLSLDERVYRCDGCGLIMDRDLNAAINIMVAGSAPETLNAHGADVRPGVPWDAGQTAVKCEPSSHHGGMSLGADGRKTVLQAKTN